MPRIWLRLELFEHGLLQFPSKYSSSLTLANVKQSLDALHVRLQEDQQRIVASEGDVDMEDTAPASAVYTESDNIRVVSFPVWKETVAPIFQWREQDYKAFWLLLVQFHRQIPVKDVYVVDSAVLFDETQCLVHQTIPLFKLAIFLFIQTVKPHSWKNKYSIETFNATWYREDFAALGQAGTAPTNPLAINGNMSPQFKGNMSPPPPQSPHTVGMQDRSTSDAYYLEFIREKLEDLFSLLYPSAELNEESTTGISAEQLDLLGFLLCAGGRSMLDYSQRVSTVYPKWVPSGESPFSENYKGDAATRMENAVKLSRFFKKHLYLNETLYPPVGFSLNALQSGSYSPVVTPSTGPAFSLADAQEPADDESNVLQRPTVLSNLSKTTVVKRAEEFADQDGNSDLVIFSCHDAYIYILGPVRYPFQRLNCLTPFVCSFTI
ncbi:hypothetical protein Poli38472_000345 [Pythium oligandrum]|uniref:Uncharacterized protein n=1 Tax=Pythium oligandrum TaxID=41045 RepID=A0A8K1CC56_PYTOL|nr:hypothetical protein Poli38472_000345 [Pythium oligandrum]|eukprot:TMW60303.1 hypothetical protein Poli38472_000345 [Pythium oligandrum]